MSDLPSSRINAVSPSFCLAKWLQVTVDLVHGRTHSCHHPIRHFIPPAELEGNPSALHNTNFKKEQRKKMLAGERPAECGYCWGVEDAGAAYSDRIIKSSDTWAYDKLEEIAALPWDADVHPTYLEVMLDDLCNFSCMYCNASVSTSIAHEMKTFGSYPIRQFDDRQPGFIPHPEPHPFREAFWKWLPELLPTLRVLRVTGGEPLLTPHFWRLLDFVAKEGRPALTFAVNSHLCHRAPKIDELCRRANELIADKRVARFEVYTSADGAGAQAEFIRHGLDYPLWLSNVERIANSIPGVQVVIMCTFNLLSIVSFRTFLDDILTLKSRGANVLLDVSCLTTPGYLRADIADDALRARVAEDLQYMRSRLGAGFTMHEIAKVENLVKWIDANSESKLQLMRRRDCLMFLNEYARRKNKSFLDLFPEYREFYVECKRAVFEFSLTTQE